MIYQLHQEPNQGYVEPHESFCGQAEILDTATQSEFNSTLSSWISSVQASHPLKEDWHWVIRGGDPDKVLQTSEEALKKAEAKFKVD